MTELERDILKAITKLQLATESAVTAALEDEWDVHPELVTASLRRLSGVGIITRNDNNQWSVLTSQGVTAPPATEGSMASRAKACSACGKDKPLSDFYDGQGRCKPCYGEMQKAAKAKRDGAAKPREQATVKTVATAIANLKAKQNGTKPQMLVSPQFVIRVKDVEGDDHVLILARDQVRTLVKELKEYA